MGVNGGNFRDFHIYGPNRKGEDRREMYASLPARDEGTDGEKGVDIDSALKRFVRYALYSILQVMFKMAIRYLLQSVWEDGVFVAGEGSLNYVVNITLHVLYKRVVQLYVQREHAMNKCVLIVEFNVSVCFIGFWLESDREKCYTETCCSREDMYPDENTPTRLFNGIPFREVPICDIKASKNNTIISVSNAQGGFSVILIADEYGMLQYSDSKICRAPPTMPF
jgi:hypothetical protein